MRILGFDTATRATAVALWDDDDQLALEARDDPPPGARPEHVARLLPQIVELLDRAGTSWGEIDRIAVGLGPGTFTGLRIGVATARALRQSSGITLVGISTLHALALGAARPDEQQPVGAIVPVIDARRGEAFVACWAQGEVQRYDAIPLFEARAAPPEALAELVAGLGQPSLAVGDGAVKFRAVLERSGASIPEDGSDLHRVSAINHCRLASERQTGASDDVRPAYLRLPDAELTRSSPSSP